MAVVVMGGGGGGVAVGLVELVRGSRISPGPKKKIKKNSSVFRQSNNN